MIADVNNYLTYNGTTNIQALTASGYTVGASSLDQLANRDLGTGETIAVVFNTDVTVAATRTGATATVVVATDICTLAAHGLPTGTPIVLTSVTTISTGFTLGKIYYVIALTANTFSLATTRAQALTGVANVDFGAADGSFVFSAIPEIDFQVIAADDAALTDGVMVLGSTGPLRCWPQGNVVVVTFTSATDVVNWDMGDAQLPEFVPVAFTNSGGGLPAELTAGKIYYAFSTGTTTFKLAATLADARAGVAIDLSGAGTGTHFLQVKDGIGVAGGPLIQPKVLDTDTIPGRYFGVRFNNGAPLSAGSFSARISPVMPQTSKVYPSGFGV